MRHVDADTFIFHDEKQVATIKVSRGQSVAILGQRGVMVRDPGIGIFEVDVIKLRQTDIDTPFPVAVIIIPSEHSFRWAALSAERASFLLAELLKSAKKGMH